MKRNFKKIAIAGALVGAITIGGATSIAVASGNSYQDYKSAVLETIKNDNVTIKSNVKIKQNGALIVEGDVENQVSDKNQYSVGKIKANDTTVDMEMSLNNNKMINRIGDKYSSISFEDRNYEENNEKDSAGGEKIMNTITDVLVGDIKNNFTRNGDNVSLSLEKSQIPELLNVAVSSMVEEKTDRVEKDKKHNDIAEMKDIETAINQIDITKNAQVKSVNLDAKLENGVIKENIIKMVITGNDDKGEAKEVEVTIDAEISNIGNTTPKTIDTTGKNVEEKTEEDFCK